MSFFLEAPTGATSVALFAAVFDDLARQGWSQQNLFLPQELTDALGAECLLLAAGGALTPALTGRGPPPSSPASSSQQAPPSRSGLRGDSIRWLEKGQSAACDQYLDIMDTLRLALNRELYLALQDYESHFAFYAPGTGYVRHLDRFGDDSARTVSAVIYLNRDWPADEGGALRLHPDAAATLDIAPLAGRLVIFMSADMVHEVLPAHRDRISLTGWFRRRAA